MFLIFFLLVAVDAQGQRVAPGVPPQNYQPHANHGGQQMHQQVPQHVPQQQMHHQAHQQQQQQQYQQQQFQQQIPIQPVQNQGPPPQQQVPSHQIPQQAHHDHAHRQNPQQLLNTANMRQETGHIEEHLEVPMDTSKMSEPELQFHYFKMHDSDNNNKLDGNELIKSLIHWHVENARDKRDAEHAHHTENKIFTDEELVNLIDPILKMDDTNWDGYIDYPEFIRAQDKNVNNNNKE